MTTLAELIERDNVEAHWFWVTSLDTGPYAENEQFDVTFVRETNYIVGGGYHARRTFHHRGTTTAQGDSRREHGGRIIQPDLPKVLASLITEAHQVAQYDDFTEWADDHRASAATHQQVMDDFAEWGELRALHKEITRWAGDEYDEYVKAAEEYMQEH